MKKIILVLTLIIGSQAAQAQFDFILEGLGSLTSTFSGDGYINTIQDLEAAQRALDLIDESRCLVDNISFGVDMYEDEIGFQCFEDTEIELARARLDNSAIVIADQIYGNVTGAFKIFQGLLTGEGDQNINSSINKGVVQDAIDNAIEALIDLLQKQETLEMERVYREEMHDEIEANEIMLTAFIETPMLDGANLGQIQNEANQEIRGATDLIDVGINILTILVFCFAAWTLRSGTDSASTIIGIIAALVAMGVANSLI